AQPSNVTDGNYDRYINSAVFADINRDGYTDVMSQVSSYGNGGRTAYWLQNADGSFTANAADQGTLNHLGGVIAYDREGDGYLDFVLADSESDSISFLKNVNGVLSYEQASGFPAGHPGGAIPSALSIMHEVGAVDIDNNGTVDITAHVDYNGAGSNAGNTSRGLGILYNQTTGTSSTNFGSVGYYANVFRNDGHGDYGNLSISMTYADYNGDGWLDLFLSRGSKGSSNSDESRIYLNDGTGKLMATDGAALWFGDTLDGGTSLAVDWNHDGKVDIIEVPRSGVTGSPVLYTNTGANSWGANAVKLTGSQTFNNLTGAVALDYDWDGSMDLVLYRGSSTSGVVSSDSAAPTLLVKNTNIAADGTSLQIRIVDGEGINTFYSNTVKLYNSAGELVATQLINPQASGSSNSMGLVSFFGLDPNEVYSVQLLRITNGVENHVGATSTIGGYTNGTVNETWGGLTTSKSHDAYVLTAENTNDAINTTGDSGITGTGYNDTFFSSLGNNTYTGGGGWNLIMKGEAVWSETEGLDIVDYSRATSGVTANLRTGTATGHGTDKLVSIEGLVGSAYNDTFTDSAANNQFEGGAGDDTFNLYNGGNDRLIYSVIAGKEGDATGGIGHDTIFGFKVGDLRTDNNADRIDLSDLLNYSGQVSYYMDEGKMTLDYASRGVLDYLKVEFNGSDTVISIDRDGKGGAYGFQELITLKGVNTNLETLLVNNQIEVGDDNIVAKTATTESLLSITQMFTGGDDIMFGTDKADVLMGGLGDDTFIGVGKGDKVMGGEGNDTISIISTDFASISGDEGIDTLILDMSGELLDLSALKDKLSSVEIFDMGNGNNTMNVSLEDVLRLGSEELAINSGNKAIVVNGEAGSTLQLDGADGQWTMSQSNYQYQGNTYNVWTSGTSGIEVLVENTVNPVIL
ncbi:MAG: FG-GAP-like repeat-containing protein, partial [Limnobaculum xujianqingii]